MKKRKALLAVILAFALVMGGAYILYHRLSRELSPDQLAARDEAESPPQEDGEPGEPEKILVPDFTVYDRDGSEVHLSDFVGKPVVLNFWASWCGPCRSEMPGFEEAYTELGEEIHFLMVNVTASSRETFENAAAFLDEQGYTFPVFYDLDGDAAKTYGVRSLPATLFIDAEGYGIAQAAGAIDPETLQRGIDLIQ